MAPKQLDIRTEHFASLGEFVKAAQTREPFRWAGHSRDSQSDSYEGDTFHGCESFEQALDRLANGWDEPLDQMREGTDKLAKVKRVESRSQTQIRRHIVGSCPNVPRALAGLPDAMYRPERESIPSKTIHILYDAAIIARVGSDAVLKGGIVVLSLVQTLERMGYRVKLTLCAGSVMSGYDPTTGAHISAGAFVSMPLKDYRQPLDLKKLCFPLANSDMFRRLVFSWRETSPVVPCYDGGYGSSFNNNEDYKAQVREQYAKERGYYFSLGDVQNAEHDVDALMRNLGIVTAPAKTGGQS